ncbi:SCO7613 C-terminal domain-containing membrane protein [Geodermatophilus sp. SYSU D01176]
MTSTSGPSWSPPCPVCGLPSAGPGPAPCPSCGLPAVGEAARVVARIGATIDELVRDRDRLLATLRTATVAPPPAPAPSAAPPAPVLRVPAPTPPPPAAAPTPPPLFPTPPGRPPRRVSPQQVLLGLGALLVVAAGLAFVAVAWTRLGLVFQSAVMATVTATACGVSAWTARRGLRATEEALAAAGAALLAVDLGAAHALGLWGLDVVPDRLWAAVSCAVVAAAALGLGRVTPGTVTWPLAALLAAQPVPLLLLPMDAVTTAAGVAAVLGTALLDLVVLLRLRRALAPVALGLAALWAAVAAGGGVLVAWAGTAADAWTTTALLAAAGAVALLLRQDARLAARLPAAPVLARAGAAVSALALTGALARAELPGWVTAAGLGIALLTAAVLAAPRRTALAALLAAGGVLTAGGAGLLAVDGRDGVLGLVVLAGTVPAALAAARLATRRPQTVGAALLCPVGAALLAREDGWLSTAVAGLLIVLVAAAGFALAAARAGRPEEPSAAGTAALAALLAAGSTAETGAWGQVAVQLGIAGAAAGAYALVAARRDVAVLAVADLVLACWVAAGGAAVQTVEVYTLPAAVGLLVVAVPHLRAGARSWAAEGAAVATALVPSALVVVAEPSALRLVLVVVVAAGLTVAGTLTHRQAPFVVGAGALAFVVLGRLTPYAPLAPRWLTLAVVGLLLLALGATYERRRQQVREAVAWVAQMR